MDKINPNFWKGRRTLVTGATGLLGSWLVEGLVARGARVTALIRDHVAGNRLTTTGLINRIDVVHGELEDFTLLIRALNEYEINSVFHIGAQTIVGTAQRSALSTFEANIRGTWNLLEACRACAQRIERIVVASSDKAYGSPERLPYTEDTPLQGRFPYDVSKSCTDLISFSYYHTYGLPVAVTRCGNLYGGGDLNFNRIVPGTIQSALQDAPPIIRSDGRYVRDYFFVRDAVDAYLMLAERLPEAPFAGSAFNLGTETPMSVIEIVDKILQIMDKTSLKPVILNEAAGEIREQYLDCTRAKTWLGWRSKYSLEDALRETIDWYRNHLGFPSR